MKKYTSDETVRYFHDCGGVHACGPALDDLGFECVGISEIEKFPIAVVKHHYPNLTQYGDTTKIKGADIPRINLLVGGTPCQGFSVAGKRGGLDDERSNLALNFLRLAAECNPRWIVWENVPGASSTNEGQDLLAFAQEVGKLGYGFAWRTLDAQYYGVPQKRRRIFLVGYFGDWRPAAAVLFESDCLRGNIAPGRKTGERTATAFEIGPSGNRETDTAPTLDTGCKDGPIRNQVGLAVLQTFDMLAIGEYRTGDKASTIKQRDYKDATDLVVYENHQTTGIGEPGDKMMTLRAVWNQHAIGHCGTVRRLTPLECCRLQGFPDNWCRIPWKGKPAEQCPDGHQYKAYGNSIAVPVLRQLGKRIKLVSNLTA